MITVYVIKSELFGMLYVGITKNLERRLKEHNSGKSRYTKAYVPWRVVYTEECSDYGAARQREKYLKSGVGKEFIRIRIGH